MHFAFIQGIGPLELTIVLVIVLLIFGPKRLPGVARSVGSGMREFKDSLTGGGSDDKADDERESPVAARAALSPSDEPAPARVTTTAEAQPVATERS